MKSPRRRPRWTGGWLPSSTHQPRCPITSHHPVSPHSPYPSRSTSIYRMSPSTPTTSSTHPRAWSGCTSSTSRSERRRGGRPTLLLTTYYLLLLTTHYSLLTTHPLLLSTHHSSLATHHSLLTTHYSPLIIRFSPLTTHYSLLTTHHSLLPFRCNLSNNTAANHGGLVYADMATDVRM